MKKHLTFFLCCISLFLNATVIDLCLAVDAGTSVNLERGFENPPMESRIRAYWWWLNGNVTPEAISRDLREMKKMGWGGALVCDADGSNQRGNRQVPAGPLYAGPEWRKLLVHALEEADKQGLELSIGIQSGWNVGGPDVQPETAAKHVVWSQMEIVGGAKINIALPVPKHDPRFYRDIAVVGYAIKSTKNSTNSSTQQTSAGDNEKQSDKKTAQRPIKDFLDKIAVKELTWSCPETTYTLQDVQPLAGEEDTHIKDVVDLTKYMSDKGDLLWDAPPGKWQILRFGYSTTGAKVSTSSKGWSGLVIDYLDQEAFRTYWNQVAAPLMVDAGPWLGKSLKYLQTDSWEAGGMNWSKNFREEFLKRRGYDLLPFMPVLAGRIVENRSVSNRFLNDFRRTIGDCVADNHYGLYAELAHQNKLGIHPESGGPHGAPIDALKCLGRGDFPMMEFWSKSPQHRVKDEDRFFSKQGASAAHIYGKKLVASEGFTNIGLHWEESFGSNLKPAFDRSACEGFNCLYWHAFTCSPESMGLPGQEYFAGTHCNPNATWWKLSGDFVKYMNRCQYLLQQGLFVADVCYYYGDHVPNFVQLKTADPAHALPEYDYDVMNEEVLLERMQCRDGRLVLPDGMSYRVLVLPEHGIISLEALRKLAKLVEAGATVIGPKPVAVTGLKNYPACDAELAAIADKMWGPCDGKTVTQNTFGKGRVFWGKSAKEVLALSGVLPDFDCKGEDEKDTLDYIHRRVGEADIYFISNQSDRAEYFECTFRVANKSPEIWSPDRGEIRQAMLFDCRKDQRTAMPLYLEPYGSTFVVFRAAAKKNYATLAKDGKALFPFSTFPYKTGKQSIAPVAVFADKNGKAVIEARERGDYELKNENGQTVSVEVREPRSLAIHGPWEVSFAPGWGAPESTTFEKLNSWTENADPNIKYYSGIATYLRELDVPAEMLGSAGVLELDLGELREMAEVTINGKSLGVVWKTPYRVDISAVAKAGKNTLEIKVANQWVNRIIGDQKLPAQQRKTKTNITKFDKGDLKPLPSGLFGPINLRQIPITPCEVLE